MQIGQFRSGLAVLLTATGLLAGCQALLAETKTSPLVVSISPFPYDKTAEAVDTVNRIVRENSNLYTVQLDNGIPWEDAFRGKAYSSEVIGQWERHKKARGSNPVYLAIAPLAEDRTSWAPSAEGKKSPDWARDEKHATASLKSAYAKHVLQAIEYFHPDYVNIGVEAGDMAAKKADKWPIFEELFTDCVKQIRAKYPAVKVGISFGLPFLMKSGVRERAAKVIDQSDYLGISFYPYMSDFYSKLGAARLPAPPAQWREPLDWLRQNVNKPIAICETAYSSKPVDLPKYGLKLKGDDKNQNDYVAELAAIARRDHYLFTVFFLSVDYVPLLAKLPEGDGSAGLWKHTGFFDENLKEKPAWRGYQKEWLGRSVVETAVKPVKTETPSTTQKITPATELAFNSKSDLFTAPSPNEISLVTDKDRREMRWKYTVRPKEFSWAVKDLPKGSAEGSRGLAFALKSDSERPMLLQVEQSDGGTFFQVFQTKKDWYTHELSWSSFKPDPNKGYKGKLDTRILNRVMLVDPSGVDDKKASGGRTLEMSDLRYLKQ